MSEPDQHAGTVIPEHLMFSRLAQSDQMRKFFIQMWIKNRGLAKQGGSKVPGLLSALAVVNAREMGFDSDISGSGVNKKQRGFSLVSAIFLLVVIAALGTFAVTLSTTQQQSSALDVLGARGFQASRAGIEWGAYQVLPASAAAFASTCRSAGSNNQANIPLPATLASFTVSVGCTATSAVEDVSTLWVYQLNSVATTPGIAVGNANYVERQMSVTIAQ